MTIALAVASSSRGHHFPRSDSTVAAAQYIVLDPTNYVQNVLTAARELQQADNEIQGLTNQAQNIAFNVQEALAKR